MEYSETAVLRVAVSVALLASPGKRIWARNVVDKEENPVLKFGAVWKQYAAPAEKPEE